MKFFVRSIFVFVSLFVPFCWSSCRFNANLQGRGTDFLQGAWQEDKVPYETKLLEYAKRKFVFTCDSFYATFNTQSKVNKLSDSCFNNGHWMEYAKGTYAVRHDTLFFYGTYTKANFKQKISGCYHIGQYLATFLIQKHTPDSLYLQGTQEHLPLWLRLKQKITCTPKPIE